MPPKRCSPFALIGLLLCLATASQAQMLPRNVWTGAVSNVWGSAGNWSLGHAPNSGEDAEISNGANVVALGSIACSSFYLNKGTLRVAGAVSLYTANIDTGTTFTFASGASHKVKGAIGAHGTIIWEGGNIDGQMNGAHLSGFNLYPGSVFIDQANGAVMRNNITVSHFGTYRKQGGSSEIAVPFTTGGSIAANAGVVAFQKLTSVVGGVRVTAATGAVCTLACATNDRVELGDSSQFSGAGQIVLDGYFYGSLNGTVSFRRRFGGILTITAGSTVNLEGEVGSPCYIDGVITNHGKIVWKGSRLEVAPTALPAWGTLTNASDGLFESRSTSASSIAIYLLTNNGTLRKMGAAELSLGALQNNGLIEVKAGSLVVADLDGNNGAVQAASGTKAEFRTSGASATLDANSTFSGNGDIALNGDFSGTLRGKARLHGAFAGYLTVASGSTLTVAEPEGSSLQLKGTVSVEGTLRWLSGDISSDALFSSRGVETTATGLFDIRTDATYGPNLILTNKGVLAKTAGAGTTTMSVVLSNFGTVEARSGTLKIEAGIYQQTGSTRLAGGDLEVGAPDGGSFVGGTLAGSGTITGNVYFNGGTLLLDEPPGQSLHVTGSLGLWNTSTVVVAAVGTAPDGFGRVVVDGAASLAGTLTFTTRDGYVPPLLARLPIITAGSVTGTFATCTFPTPPATTHYAMSYGANLAEITVVPPPFTGWKYAHFGTETDPAIIGELADPDGDGSTNLLEYALGSDPLNPTSAGTCRVFVYRDTSSAMSYLCMTYRSPETATDIEVVPEISSDLATWNSGDLYFSVLNSSTVDGMRTVTIQAMGVVEYANRRFLRLRVRRTPG